MSDEPTIKFRRLHPDARQPMSAHIGDAGYDLWTVVWFRVPARGIARVPIGLSIEVPEGWYGQIASRSGLATKGVVVVGGVLDSSFRGEVQVILANLGDEPIEFYAGQKIAQLLVLPVPACRWVEASELAPSDRGANGFGSSDTRPAADPPIVDDDDGGDRVRDETVADPVYGIDNTREDGK